MSSKFLDFSEKFSKKSTWSENKSSKKGIIFSKEKITQFFPKKKKKINKKKKFFYQIHFFFFEKNFPF